MEIFEILAKGGLRLASPIAQDFSDSGYTVMGVFDTSTRERGGVTPHPTENNIAVRDAGDYTLNIGVNFECLATEEFDMIPYVNGVAMSTYPIRLQGAGAGKPVAVTWSSEIVLGAGAVVDIRAINGDAGSVNVTFSRTYFTLLKDS